MIGIRVDANEEIAMGHLMRCLSIAKQLKCMGQRVIFLVSEEYSVRQLEQSGFVCICFKNSYKDKERELETLITFIKKYSINKLLIDSYEVTQTYMNSLKEYCQLIYIDDLNLFRYPVDMIINYTFKTDKSLYSDKNYSTEIFLLGERYIPLREEFTEGCIEVKEEAKKIFLTTGGTDSFNMLVSILNQMQQNDVLKSLEKHVVVGKFYQHFNGLNQLIQEYENIYVYHNIADIWNIMRMCDIAVSAGGTTLAELCACGVPTVCFAIAENQIAGTTAYAKEGMMFFAGNAMDNKNAVVDNVISKVECLVKDSSLRRDMGQRANLHIDGKGAIRIAEEIVRL